MNVTRKQERLLRQALSEWEQEGALSAEDRLRLAGTLKRVVMDWQRLSRYAFWTAMACVVIAIGSLFADSQLMARIIAFFSLSSAARIGLPALIAGLFYLWGFSRQRRQTQWHYSTEALLFAGVFFTAIALWQLAEKLDTGSGHIAPLFLAGCVFYGLVGFFGRSGLVWLFFLLSLGNWLGAQTGYMSGWGAYWLGMNYPLRFIFFGGLLLALCLALRTMLQARHLYTTSKAMGLSWLFIALWIMSIFGNNDPDFGYSRTPLSLLPWVLLFAAAALICIVISLKTDDGMLRGFGLTFLAINLYTRYFEYFWDGMNKVLFFLLLAASLALVGRYAERIWHAGRSAK